MCNLTNRVPFVMMFHVPSPFRPEHASCRMFLRFLDLTSSVPPCNVPGLSSFVPNPVPSTPPTNFCDFAIGAVSALDRPPTGLVVA